MILALLQTIMISLAWVFRKRSLNMSNLPSYLFALFWNITWIVLAFILIFIWWFDLAIFYNWLFLLLLLVAVFVYIFKTPAFQNLYKSEKMSVLMPYDNLSQILVVIVWFFFISTSKTHISVESLLITITAILVIALFKIDFKNQRMPNNIKLIIVSQWLQSIQILNVAYIFTIPWVDEKIYYILYVALITLLYVIFMLYKRDLIKLKWLSLQFHINRHLAGVLWFTWWLIWLYFVKSFGIVITVLLSYLGLIFTLLFSYFMLGDKPSKKDVILCIVVTSLIWLWFVFR